MNTERETDNELSTQLNYGNMKELLEYQLCIHEYSLTLETSKNYEKKRAPKTHLPGLYKLTVDVLTMDFGSNDS